MRRWAPCGPGWGRSSGESGCGGSQWREWWRFGGPGGVGWRWSSSSSSSVRMSRRILGGVVVWPGRTSTSAFHRWDGRFDGHWKRVARQRRCFLVGAVSGLFTTTRLGTPGNARGRSDVPGPPYSLTVAIPEGNHFDVEMMTGPPNRFRNRARYARCVTQATPEPLPHGGARATSHRRLWAVAAGVVCALHVLALLGLAGFYALELACCLNNTATT